MPSGTLPILISWFMSLPGTASLTFCWGEHTGLWSPTWNGVGAAWRCRDRRVWRSKAAVAEERKKLMKKGRGWDEHETVSKGACAISMPVNLGSGVLGESPPCCQMSLGKVRPPKAPCYSNKTLTKHMIWALCQAHATKYDQCAM